MKKIFFFIIVAGSMGMISCNKQLKENPPSTVTINNFYKTSSDAQAAVNGIYAFVYPPYSKSGFDDLPYTMLEIVTGLYTNKSQSSYTASYYNLRYNSADTYVSTWWNSSYEGIEAANLAIANIPDINMDTTLKAQLMGEARFLRAYFYYNLVNIFGPVPMKVKPTNAPSDGLLPKTSVKNIYDSVIVPDLLAAAASPLVSTPNGNGRVSLGAAQTLLAKVYLTMAGNPVNEADKMALARDQALAVINSNAFSLFQTDANLSWFNKLNNAAFDNTQEVIYAINYQANVNDASLPNFFLPQESLFTPFLQFGGFYPNTPFLNSFAPNDLRGLHNMGFFYDSIVVSGVTHHFPWAMYKFFDQGLIANSPHSGKGYDILRYADLLLVYAEAENEADGGANATAYASLNSIRVRAGLAPVAGLSQSDFRTEVWKERYWELCAENKTWFDIVRTQKIFDVTNSQFVNVVGFTLPNGAAFTQADLQFPIPLSEVEVNPLLK
jgi:starch-binding outer membrane protein, SusD/RagB family